MSGPTVESGGAVRTVEAESGDEGRFLEVLAECGKLLSGADIEYLVMGGLAIRILARPRWTHDVDLLLRPRHARRALEVLGEHGYETEETDPLWLFKARRDDVPVDLIFRSTGQIYLDDLMYARGVEQTFHGQRLRLAAPEDLIVIKAAAHREEGGYHWFDALALLATQELDWDYLAFRARRSLRRVLSLLVYADAMDIAVPHDVIAELSRQAYGDGRPTPAPDTPARRQVPLGPA